MQDQIIDTLTHPATKVVGGAIPIALQETAQLPNLHNVGATIVSYGGALLASTLIHLVFSLGKKLIDKLKSKTSNVQTN